MLKPISSLSHAGYKAVAKPLLFMQKPDIVHQRLLWSGSKVQNLAAMRRLLDGAWAYKNDAMLSQTVRGIEFKNPVGLSAGFDKNFELVRLMKAVGFGFMEGGSLTYHECAGNPRPWFYRLPKSKSLVVNAGLANQGVTKIVERITQYPEDTFRGFPLNISVAKTNSPEACTDDDAIADYIGSLRAIRKAGALGQLITLNISCPNTYGGEPFTEPRRLARLLQKVDALRLTQPVFVKMPNDLSWHELDQLLAVTANHAIAGVTISNLTKDRQTDIRDKLPDTVKGKLSGKPTWHRSNELIRLTYKKYGTRLTIIGVGGIFSAEDAYVKIRLGASLVELITGMIFEGPQLIGQINRGLVDLLKRDGFAHISQVIGIDA